MTDPMSDIENEQAQHDIGVIAHRIYSGARADGAPFLTALGIVYAWFRASLKHSTEDDA